MLRLLDAPRTDPDEQPDYQPQYQPHNWHRWPSIPALSCLLIKLWLASLLASFLIVIPCLFFMVVLQALIPTGRWYGGSTRCGISIASPLC